MSSIDTKHGRRAGLRRLLGPLGLGLLLAAAVLPSFAYSGGEGCTSTSSSGGEGYGDDFIGTLPCYGPETSHDLFPAFQPASLNIVVEGPRTAILRHLIDARGERGAWVHLEVSDERRDAIRMVFHGDATVVFGLGLFRDPDVKVHGRVGPALVGGRAQIRWNDRVTQPFSLAPEGFDVPVLRLEQIGVLPQGPVYVDAVGRFGDRKQVTIEGSASVVRLTQQQ
jgi:hypothetical protein